MSIQMDAFSANNPTRMRADLHENPFTFPAIVQKRKIN